MLKMKVSNRIYAGFAIVITALLLLAGLSISTVSTSKATLETLDSVSDNAQRVLRIRGAFTDIRRNVILLIEKGDNTAPNNIAPLQSLISQDLPKAISVTINPERKANLERMKVLFDNYMADFSKVASLQQTKSDAIQKRMNVVGVEARKDLTYILDSAVADGDFEAAALAGIAEEALMLGRLNAIKYIASPDEGLAEEAQKQIAVFVEKANALTKRLHNPERKKRAQEAEDKAEQYRAAFESVHSATKTLDDFVYKKMAEEAGQFRDLAEQTVASQDQALNKIREDTVASMDRSEVATWIGSALALGLACLFAYLIARSIVVPLSAMTGAMTELSKGNRHVPIPATERTDEIGEMAAAMQVFKENTLKMEQMQKEQEEQKIRSEAERKAALRQLANTFEGSVGKVIETVSSASTELQASATQMASTATETSAQATTVASASQQASANVQTVASATEELSSSISEIAKQVERSQAVAVRAEQEAESTTIQVRALYENANKIGEIINLINDIASQTNLLALNATIEAARACDAGKGFAVVANEVKHLANQTGKATDEIAAQIKAVQEGTNNAVHAIDTISKVISEMGEISASVASAVQEQSAATSEIARNVEQAAAGTAEVSSSVTTVEQAARDTGAAAEQIRASATDLSKQSEYLRAEVGRFLNQVRADKDDMKILEWNDDLLTRVTTLDRHHQDMFNQINKLYADLMQGQGTQAGAALISMVDDSITPHMREEEDFMRQKSYPAIEEHRRSHQAFLSNFSAHRANIQAGKPDAASKAFEAAATWLGNHIRFEDAKIAAFLRENN